MNKVAIYVRVSTHHQIDKDSLPLQRKDLINYAECILNTNNYTIFEDAGYSGKNTDRPAFKNMMSQIKKGEFTHLLVWKIDRISRNLLDFCDMYNELKNNNCVFISRNEQFDTSSAMGEAMLKIILVFAELERKLTGERVKAVMLDRATKGKWNGAPIPLGYKWNEEIKFPVPDVEESKTIRVIYEKYKETTSTSATRNYLNSMGYKTKKGGTWTTKTISDILRNPFYKGTYRYNFRETGRGKKKDKSEWILIDNNHEGIISLELWQQCNEILDRNAEHNSAIYRKNSVIHVFAGLLECNECHSNMYSKQDKPRLDGSRPSYYLCRTRYNAIGTCNQKTVPEKYIGNFIFNLIKNIITIDKRTTINSKNIENIVLKNVDKNLLGLEEESISNLLAALNIKTTNNYNSKIKPETNNKDEFETTNLSKRKEKLNRALKRLDDLYLFDDEAMSEKDYILKKNNIKDEIDKIDKLMHKDTNVPDINLSVLASNALLTSKIKKNDKIDYEELISEVGKDILKDFVNTIIDKIYVEDKQIKEIKFKNKLDLKFYFPS